ncbi:MAG: transposase [Chloroflexi bacterium]|nr:transposase [Chloroflexota bacterium]
MFEDEFGISYTESVSTPWAPRGQTPYLKRVGKYRREISTMAGLTVSGKIYKKHFEGSINSIKLIQGLEHFRRQIRRPFILIWDRSRTHRSKLMKGYLAQHPEIHIEFLPAYAPEVNPEEFCHGNVKRKVKNAIFTSQPEIRKKLDNRFASLRKRPTVLLGCFHHAGLALKQLW